MRTKVLRGNGYIRYEVQPGDDAEPAGELIVVHEDRRPALPQPTFAREAPEEEPVQRPLRREQCLKERGALLTRIFEMRGLQVDPEFARWLERNLTVGSRGIPSLQIEQEPLVLTAIRSDGIARMLAEDLARCEQAAR